MRKAPGTVEDFAEVVGGGTPATKEPSYWGGDVIWVTPTDITGARRSVLNGSERRITNAGLDNSSARLVPAGSVLVTARPPSARPLSLDVRSRQTRV